MDWLIHPHPFVFGSLRVPGDKSISHRAALMASIGTGVSTLHGFLDSEDCLNLLSALVQLGAGVTREGATVRITGMQRTPLAPRKPLDCGNSGTAMRLLSGLVAGLPVACELTGDASLLRRPMNRIIEPLSWMQADIEALGGEGRAPLRIRGGGLHGIDYVMPVASAQVKSCLLLAGLRAHGRTVLTEPAPSRDHTERMFAALGLPLQRLGNRIELEGAGDRQPEIQAADWTIPGDFSSAAFWLVAAAVTRNSRVMLQRVGLNPRRTALLDVLRRMGADIQLSSQGGQEWEPYADITVSGAKRLRATTVCGSEIPNLIDEIPILCVAASFAEGETRILDAAELRVKESDRIATTLACLQAFGVPCTDLGDGLSVRGPSRPRGGGRASSYGDHRIAMAAAVLALTADSPTRILDVDCVSTSYPGFRRHLRQLTPDCLNPQYELS